MSYKDDLKKLREEANIPLDDAAHPLHGSGKDATDDASAITEPYKSEEKKLSFTQRIMLPFVQNSFRSVLFFALVSIVWAVVTHTIVASVKEIDRSALVIFFIKDIAYIIVIAIIMYRIFCAQFAHSYHLEQDNEDLIKKARTWQAIQRSMMETVPDMLVYTLDRDFRYTSFNTRHKYSMLRMWHKEIQVGDSILDMITETEVLEKTKGYLTQALKGEYLSNIEKFGENDTTATYWQTYYAPILNEKREIIGISCFVANITSLKQSQSKNLFLSYHDPLTKLYNRVYCEDVFAQAEREEICPYSIIVADIRGMRQINENYGHATGDKLLIKVSEIMTKTVKDAGIVARWGSDEYIVLLPKTDSVKAEALANICKCNFPGVTVDGIPIRVRIGFATRSDLDQSISETLLSAEQASTQNVV